MLPVHRSPADSPSTNICLSFEASAEKDTIEGVLNGGECEACQ